MNKKDFKIYREGYMLGVKETLDMVLPYISSPNPLDKNHSQQNKNKGKDEKDFVSFVNTSSCLKKTDKTGSADTLRGSNPEKFDEGDIVPSSQSTEDLK